MASGNLRYAGKIHCLSEASLNFSGMVLANFRKLSIPASAAVSENKYFPVRPHTRHPQKETQKDPRSISESLKLLKSIMLISSG